MEPREKARTLRYLVIIIILFILVLAFFLFRTGKLNFSNSCDAVRKQYEKAKEVEDYADVSKYYQQMNELNCEF